MGRGLKRGITDRYCVDFNIDEKIFRITIFENLGHLNKTVDTFEPNEVMNNLNYSNWIFLNNLGKVSINQVLSMTN